MEVYEMLDTNELSGDELSLRRHMPEGRFQNHEELEFAGKQVAQWQEI
jgi:hypothetical protein